MKPSSTSFVPFLASALAALAVACSGGDKPSGESTDDVKGSSSSSSGGSSSSSGSSGKAGGNPIGGGSSSSSSSSSSSGGGNCVDVGGSWKGTVDGQTTQQQPITGTAALKLDPGDGAGNFKVATGSKFDVAIDTGTILGKVNTTQELAGAVTCGKLAGTSDATVAGQHLAGTATCTFTADGCSGTYEVHDDTGAAVANGTFKLQR